MLISN